LIIKNLTERTYTNLVCRRKFNRKRDLFCVIILRSFYERLHIFLFETKFM